MHQIESSELVLNTKGHIYHLDLSPEMLSRKLFVMGDPNRVGEMGQRMDSIEFDQQNREFRTITGRIGSERVTLLSHGIGTDNIDIVLNELDALVNVNLETRIVKEEKTSLQIVRLGTTGALQKDIELGTIIRSDFAIGLDNLMWFYPRETLNSELQNTFETAAHWSSDLPTPYAVQGSSLLKEAYAETPSGITLTSPGFYGPQGRELRISSKIKSHIDLALSMEFKGYRITNCEMETSGLYGLSNLLGHESITLCAAIANRANGTFLTDHQPVIDKLLDYSIAGLTN